MKKFVRTILFCCLLFLSSHTWANDTSIVRFDINTVQLNEKEQLLRIKAIVSPDVKLYGLQGTGNEVLFSSISR